MCRKAIVVTFIVLLASPAVLLAKGKGGGGKGRGKSGGEKSSQDQPSSAKLEKLTLCHLPPGDPDNYKTKTVDANALDSHFGHGDVEGVCDEETLIKVRHRKARLDEIDHDRDQALARARQERDRAYQRTQHMARRDGERAEADKNRSRARSDVKLDEMSRRILGGYDSARARILGGEEDARALADALDKKQ